MKTESKDQVKPEEVIEALGPELMELLAAGLHTAVHEDALVPRKSPVDKPAKPATS